MCLVICSLEIPRGGISFIFFEIHNDFNSLDCFWRDSIFIILIWFNSLIIKRILCTRASTTNGILVSHWDKHLSYHLVWININFIFLFSLLIKLCFFYSFRREYASFSFSRGMAGWLDRSCEIQYYTKRGKKHTLNLILMFVLSWKANWFYKNLNIYDLMNIVDGIFELLKQNKTRQNLSLNFSVFFSSIWKRVFYTYSEWPYCLFCFFFSS